MRRMLKIPWTEKKSNEEVFQEAGVHRTLLKRIRQRQLAFLGHVLRRQSLENLVVTGRIDGRRARGRQRLKYLDSLCDSLKDKVSPTPVAHQGFRGQRALAAHGRQRRRRWHGNMT